MVFWHDSALHGVFWLDRAQYRVFFNHSTTTAISTGTVHSFKTAASYSNGCSPSVEVDGLYLPHEGGPVPIPWLITAGAPTSLQPSHPHVVGRVRWVHNPGTSRQQVLDFPPLVEIRPALAACMDEVSMQQQQQQQQQKLTPCLHHSSPMP